MCVSQEIFGEKQGIQLLYMLAKYGFNGSPFPFGNDRGDFWESNGLDNVLVGLSHFPENTFPIFYNRPLLRLKKESTKTEDAKQHQGKDVCTEANSFIEVFDCIYKAGSKTIFIETIVHEVAHIIGSEAELDRSSTWWKFSGWKEVWTYDDNTINVSYELDNPDCVVSEYGKAFSNRRFC